ncbi:MAG: hypothetical protein HQK84_09475 [Nitrospinae bacterium]|nr:hypothetical protein [Nitrospinota bacterium]
MVNKEMIKEHFALYGFDIEQWPREIRNELMKGYKDSSEFQEMAKKEKLFEEFISLRSFEAPSSSLADRIINSAVVSKNEEIPFIQMLQELFQRVFPKPAIALAFSLFIGFYVGFSYSLTDSQEKVSYSVLDETLYFEEESI